MQLEYSNLGRASFGGRILRNFVMMNENFVLCVYFMCAFLIFQSEKQICHNFILCVIGLSRIWWSSAFIIFSFSFYIFQFYFLNFVSFFCCRVGGWAQVVVRLMLINYMAAFKLKSATTTQTNLIEKLLLSRFAYKSVSQASKQAGGGRGRSKRQPWARQTAFASIGRAVDRAIDS